MDELLDLVNENDEIIGEVWKSEAHKNPKLIHREVGIIIFNKKSEVLLQQRSMNKKNEPGAWKISAAGHIEKGEAPEDAIKREVMEELGIEVDPIFHEKYFSTYKDQESRFFWIYYAILEETLPLKLDPEEVMDAKWVKVADFGIFAKTNNFNPTGPSSLMAVELHKLLKLA